MNEKNEAQILADTFESVRSLTKWYISKMKDSDMHKQFEVNGTKLNTAYWVVGHLAWAEQFLLLQALDGNTLNIPWLEQFRIDTKVPDDKTGLPAVKEVLDTWKEIHAASMTHLRSLPDELMGKDNPAGLGFAGDNSYRMMIHHAIRHEAMHTGHLSWLCKLYGIKTI